MNKNTHKIYPVILSGGSGTRLWPMSSSDYPKQFQPLVSTRSLIQETVLRFTDKVFAPPIFICNEEQGSIVSQQMQDIGIKPMSILLEPEARNTAPAAVAAAAFINKIDPDGLMLLLPSDHVIENIDEYIRILLVGAEAANKGALVTLGITPNFPETGYGYIRKGDAFNNITGSFHVDRFVEKPDLKTAKEYLSDGNYYWNSGMFLFRTDVFLKEMKKFEPEMLTACIAAVENARKENDFLYLDKENFAKSRAVSIDYAVMEHTTRAVVTPVDMGWNDVGSWSALWDIGDKDKNGNVVKGKAILHDVSDSYIHTTGIQIAAVGVSDIAIIATEDTVLVVPKEKSQDVKFIAEAIEKAKKEPS
ncbi:MAG: mannose-1-phosphate guanylyltransferase/mannose-6-phosphate isomerase [Alphaproteobacteria bacterium]|nr:mannose-1-phosphate guanylyltransferase/mannose-6-phosphate isomerase [Alphaproteobacteria bacterium]